MHTHSRHASRPVRFARIPLVLGAALVASLLGACSSYQAPSMQIVDARVIERTAEGAVVQFTIEAKNDNADPLPLREARYSLELDGRTVFSGERSAQATLKRSGTQQFVLPAAIKSSFLDSLGPSPRYRLAGAMTYITPGAFAELLFDTGVARPSASFSAEGTVDLPASVAAPAVTIGLR